MGFLSELEALLHPGGDPDAIFAAAAATHALANGLRDSAKSLDGDAAEIEKAWHGIGDGADETTAAKYQAAWKSFSNAIVEYAGHLDNEADTIHKQGEALQILQSQAVKLDWIAGLTAGAFVLGAVTLGIFDIGAAAEFEMAANEIAVAAGVMTEMEAMIANGLIVLDSVLDAAAGLAANFVLGAFADGTALVLEKIEDHQNPLSLTSWTPDDVSNVILGGLVSGAAGVAFNKVGALVAFREAHPLLATATWNSSTAFAWAVPWEFVFKGEPFDLQTWESIFESAAVSFASAPFYKGLGKVIPALGRVLSDDGPTGLPGVTKADVADNLISIPITGEKLFFITGEPPFKIHSSPAAPTALPGVPVPQALNGTPVRPIPPHIGGGTETVKSGDNLYDISSRTLGNPNLYPVLQAANPLMVGPNGEIVPGQKLLIPVLPPVPKGSTAQVVQPGQSLSDFAGGDPKIEQQIAELNGLKNENLIFPGQVLIVPPAG
jgi:uncharacterized protein YukE